VLDLGQRPLGEFNLAADFSAGMPSGGRAWRTHSRQHSGAATAPEIPVRAPAQVQTGELLFHLAGDGHELLQAVCAPLAQLVKPNVPRDAGAPFFAHFTMQDNRFYLARSDEGSIDEGSIRVPRRASREPGGR
jgi:hypothetical protein